jgi:ribonuclease T2
MSGRVDRSLVAALADIMPDGGLVGHQWRRHGMCSGLSAADYFALVRRALAVVSPPALGADPDRRMTPAAIEAAFAARNLGLSPRGMSVQCRAGALTEVRICLTGDLEFRACAEVDRDACGAGTVRVPPPD